MPGVLDEVGCFDDLSEWWSETTSDMRKAWRSTVIDWKNMRLYPDVRQHFRTVTAPWLKLHWIHVSEASKAFTRAGLWDCREGSHWRDYGKAFRTGGSTLGDARFDEANQKIVTRLDNRIQELKTEKTFYEAEQGDFLNRIQALRVELENDADVQIEGEVKREDWQNQITVLQNAVNGAFAPGDRNRGEAWWDDYNQKIDDLYQYHTFPRHEEYGMYKDYPTILQTPVKHDIHALYKRLDVIDAQLKLYRESLIQEQERGRSKKVQQQGGLDEPVPAPHFKDKGLNNKLMGPLLFGSLTVPSVIIALPAFIVKTVSLHFSTTVAASIVKYSGLVLSATVFPWFVAAGFSFAIAGYQNCWKALKYGGFKRLQVAHDPSNDHGRLDYSRRGFFGNLMSFVLLGGGIGSIFGPGGILFGLAIGAGVGLVSTMGVVNIARACAAFARGVRWAAYGERNEDERAKEGKFYWAGFGLGIVFKNIAGFFSGMFLGTLRGLQKGFCIKKGYSLKELVWEFCSLNELTGKSSDDATWYDDEVRQFDSKANPVGFYMYQGAFHVFARVGIAIRFIVENFTLGLGGPASGLFLGIKAGAAFEPKLLEDPYSEWNLLGKVLHYTVGGPVAFIVAACRVVAESLVVLVTLIGVGLTAGLRSGYEYVFFGKRARIEERQQSGNDTSSETDQSVFDPDAPPEPKDLYESYLRGVGTFFGKHRLPVVNYLMHTRGAKLFTRGVNFIGILCSLPFRAVVFVLRVIIAGASYLAGCMLDFGKGLWEGLFSPTPEDSSKRWKTSLVDAASRSMKLGFGIGLGFRNIAGFFAGIVGGIFIGFSVGFFVVNEKKTVAEVLGYLRVDTNKIFDQRNKGARFSFYVTSVIFTAIGVFFQAVFENFTVGLFGGPLSGLFCGASAGFNFDKGSVRASLQDRYSRWNVVGKLLHYAVGIPLVLVLAIDRIVFESFVVAVFTGLGSGSKRGWGLDPLKEVGSDATTIYEKRFKSKWNIIPKVIHCVFGFIAWCVSRAAVLTVSATIALGTYLAGCIKTGLTYLAARISECGKGLWEGLFSPTPEDRGKRWNPSVDPASRLMKLGFGIGLGFRNVAGFFAGIGIGVLAGLFRGLLINENTSRETLSKSLLEGGAWFDERNQLGRGSYWLFSRVFTGIAIGIRVVLENLTLGLIKGPLYGLLSGFRVGLAGEAYSDVQKDAEDYSSWNLVGKALHLFFGGMTWNLGQFLFRAWAELKMFTVNAWKKGPSGVLKAGKEFLERAKTAWGVSKLQALGCVVGFVFGFIVAGFALIVRAVEQLLIKVWNDPLESIFLFIAVPSYPFLVGFVQALYAPFRLLDGLMNLYKGRPDWISLARDASITTIVTTLILSAVGIVSITLSAGAMIPLALLAIAFLQYAFHKLGADQAQFKESALNPLNDRLELLESAPADLPALLKDLQQQMAQHLIAVRAGSERIGLDKDNIVLDKSNMESGSGSYVYLRQLNKSKGEKLLQRMYECLLDGRVTFKSAGYAKENRALAATTKLANDNACFFPNFFRPAPDVERHVVQLEGYRLQYNLSTDTVRLTVSNERKVKQRMAEASKGTAESSQLYERSGDDASKEAGRVSTSVTPDSFLTV